MNRSTEIFREEPIKTKINQLHLNEGIVDFTDAVLLNRYKVLHAITNNSGEALLYMAQDLSNKSKCVVKQYLRKNAISAGVISKLSSLNNPNIARILAYGVYQSFSFVVLPFYEGISLDKYIISHGTFSYEDLRNNFIPSINESLRIIHNLGIIHKDLKPSNIIITPENNFILIDFGISIESSGQTVIVSQTGKTPYYAAPETVNGAFSIYSDYYSFGICIYELFTGYTPFQSSALNEKDLALYAQMQKIPYPDNFPDELRDLIDGLTYKDLSNRNEIDNPNRRWSYEEVQKWLVGEIQQVPGKFQKTAHFAGRPNETVDFEFPYFIKGKKIYSNDELAQFFFVHWRDAVKDLGRGFLSRHYEQNADENRRVICEIAERELSNCSSDKHITVLYRLLYRLSDNVKTIAWKDFVFPSLVDYANALIDNAINGTEPEILKSVNCLLGENVLSVYAETQSLPDSLKDIINKLKLLANSEPLDDFYQALRIGYSITKREDFRIGNDVFRSIVEFNDKLNQLYEHDLNAFVNYIQKFERQLNIQKRLFASESRSLFEINLMRYQKIIKLTNEHDLFKTPEDILKYQFELWSENKIDEFYLFKSNNSSELESLDASLRKSNPPLYSTIHKYYDDMIVIDEHYFKDLNAFEKYLRRLVDLQKKYSSKNFDNFMNKHVESMADLAFENSKLMNVIKEFDSECQNSK